MSRVTSKVTSMKTVPWRRSRSALLSPTLVVSLIASLTVPHLAAAADPIPGTRQVVVVDLSKDDKTNAEIAIALRESLAAHRDAAGQNDYAVADINAALNTGGEGRDRQNAATAKGLFAAGKAAFDGKDYQEAADQLQSARDLYESCLAVVDGDAADVFGKVALALAEARLLAKDKSGAQEAFRQAAFFGATSALGSDAQAAYDAVKGAVVKLPKKALELTSAPPFAEVFLDGRPQGITPLTLDSVSVGVHILTFSKPGYERVTARVEVAPDKASRHEVKLPAARRKLILDALRPKLEAEVQAAVTPGSGSWGRGGDSLAELGTLFRTETVLLTRASGEPGAKTLELWLFHVPTQRLVSTHTRTFDWTTPNPAAIASAVAKTVEVDWVAKLGGEVKETEVTDEPGITSKWWFWTLIGVAVAGGVTGAVLATGGDTAPPPFSKDAGTGALVLRF